MTPIQVLESYTDKIQKALLNSLIKHITERSPNGKYSRGGLGQSIRVYTKIYGQKVALEISMLEYWEFVEEGRAKGKKAPPQQAMLDFIRDRGIKVDLKKYEKEKIKSLKNKRIKKALKQISLDKKRKTLAFLIGRSIKKKGIKPTHFASEVINETLVKQIKADISKAVGREIQIQLIGEIPVK